MSFLAFTVAMPNHVVDVQILDCDGDKKEEIVLIQRIPSKHALESVDLKIMAWRSKPVPLKTISLGNRATVWNLKHGMWGLGKTGIKNLFTSEQKQPIASSLQSMGEAVPLSFDFVYDLNNDGLPEYVWNDAGSLQVGTIGQQAWASVSSVQQGKLRSNRKTGGLQLDFGHRSSPLVVGDMDGDGLKDILLLQRKTAKLYQVQGRTLKQPRVIQLPIDVQPSKVQSRKRQRKELSDIWFTDINGDQKQDMVWQHWVVTGSWFGSTAQLGYAMGNGQGFSSPRYIQSSAAIFDVRLTDIDGDGDRDIVTIGADFGLRNITKALLTRSANVNLSVYLSEKNQVNPTAKMLRSFSMNVEKPDDLQFILRDFTSDGAVDLLSNDGKSQIALYPYEGNGFSKNAKLVNQLPAKMRFVAGDINGDGKLDVVAWRPDGKQYVVLLQP